MNYEVRPPRRGLLPSLSPDQVSRIERIEYVVFTKADPTLAWKIFSDIRLWPKFSDRYTSIRWQGSPWMAGSRLRLEVREPVTALVDRALTVCTPPHQVAWITHVLGYTMEQWTFLDPSHTGGTRISTWIEVAAPDLAARHDDLLLLRELLTSWFDSFSRECDRAADATDAGDIPATAD